MLDENTRNLLANSRKMSVQPVVYENATRQLSPSHIKSIRRREYYNRRIKPDFAPPNIKNEVPAIIKRLDNMEQPLTPDTRDREEQRLVYLMGLKTKLQHKVMP